MVRRLLDRKLRRDLRHHTGSLVAIAVVVACGISSFVAMRSMVSLLGDAQRAYYASSGFPDVFARVRQAPRSVERELRAIPGIARLQLRPTGEIVIRVPGLDDPATARLVGIGPASALNRIHLRRGRLPAPDEPDAVVVSEGFAVANALDIGDTLGAVLGGRWRDLRIVGVGITAEFVYELRAGDMLPDARRYGILWIDQQMAEQTLGLAGAWNELAATLQPGTNERAVLAQLDAALAPYGTLGAYGRSLHASHRFLSEEIRQNRSFAVAIPLIFLSVAAFLVHLVLSRVVTQQRDQLGTLKAYGLPTRHLIRHFVLFALVPAGAGSLGGVTLGLWGARGLGALYQSFFHFPALPFRIYPALIGVSVLIAGGAAAVGALSGLRRILSLPPAEAMRPEPPAIYARGIVERVLGRQGRPLTRMVARGVTHRPWRTMLGALGIGLGAAVVVTGTFGFDAVAQMRRVLFERATRADVTVAFAEVRGPEVAVALGGLPGVSRVEVGWDVPVRISSGQRSRTTALVGVDPGAQLRRVVDLAGVPARVSPSGLTMSAALARVLAVSRGDTVDVEFLDGRGRRISAVVALLVEDLSGSVAYVERAQLPVLVGLGPAVTRADLSTDPEVRGALYDALTHAPAVSAVTARERLRESFDATIQQNFLVVLITLVSLAAALAGGTIYNAGRVTLSERARDLASLRVLGFTRAETLRILVGELVVLAVIGIPMGLLIGIGFAWATVASFGNSDLFRLPLVIGPRTLIAGVVVPVLAAVASLWPLKRRVDRLDLIRSLKTRE